MARGPAPEKLKLGRRLRRELRGLSRRRRAPHSTVQRARIALLARRGLATVVIAREVSCTPRNVRKWKARLRADPNIEALNDRPRSGRPAFVPIDVRCELIRLACERPEGEESPAPFRDVWTQRALADALELRTSYLPIG